MSEPWEVRCILRVLSGSRAYGVAMEASDSDTRAVSIPTKRYLLGLDEIRQEVSDDDNHVTWALKRFVELALQGNPSVLEVLYTDTADQLSIDDLGRELVAARSIFLSRRVGERFIGYGTDQLARMERHRRWIVAPPANPPQPAEFGASMAGGRARFPDLDAQRAFDAALKAWQHFVAWRTERNPQRAELESRYGYDTKHAMHLIRLLRMGEEVLSGHGLIVRRPDAAELRAIREGARTYDEIVDVARAVREQVTAWRANSPLPEEPDRDAADRLVVALHERSLALS